MSWLKVIWNCSTWVIQPATVITLQRGDAVVAAADADEAAADAAATSLAATAIDARAAVDAADAAEFVFSKAMQLCCLSIMLLLMLLLLVQLLMVLLLVSVCR